MPEDTLLLLGKALKTDRHDLIFAACLTQANCFGVAEESYCTAKRKKFCSLTLAAVGQTFFDEVVEPVQRRCPEMCGTCTSSRPHLL